MKTGYLFCLVLLVVLAIPLFADHALVNTVSEFSAISTINSEEVPFNQQELFDSNIVILAVGLRKSDLLVQYGRLNANADIGNGLKKYKNKNIYGGINRIKSGRH